MKILLNVANKINLRKVITIIIISKLFQNFNE